MTAADTQNKEIVKNSTMIGEENEKIMMKDFENDITISTTYITKDVSELQLEIDKINFFPAMRFYKNGKKKKKNYFKTFW